MTANSYLEYFLTLLGWVINNGLWHILIATGLFTLPLVVKVISVWLKVRECGEEDGQAGLQSLARIENTLYGAFFVMVVCCVPLVNVSLTTLQYDTSRAKSCGTWTPTAPDNGGYAPIISSLNNQTAAVPLWWAVVHRLSKGLTQAAVASIPCRPDLRQLRFDVQHTRISNPALAAELQDFTHDCYALALYQWKQRDQEHITDPIILNDIGWLGSHTFLAGDYRMLQSRLPRADFPWQESRDNGRPYTGQGGYPTCQAWWSTAQIGLKDRVLAQADPGLWLRLSATLKILGKNTQAYQEAVIRRLVSPVNLSVSQDGYVYAGYGGSADPTLLDGANRIGTSAGALLGGLLSMPMFDAVRQALPMMQAVILMALYILIPLILLFAAYEFKTIFTLTFVIFALNFLTFWWELARWLDSHLLEALYGSDTHSLFNLAGIQNTSDDLIMGLVMGTLFIVLPMVWLGALAWAGVRMGDMAGMMSQGVGQVRQSAGMFGQLVLQKMISKGK
ncbi:conjugal transfer protein TraG N-terminal domain-containing protein [Xenorhabdus hominickii]|uniref:Conjugal transfer protein TraG n=1 Tax=Xenorhabdus hominickii TaxID=351679 RepID=A0A2G0Q882_XENHO|nr:conjugal transfer protein TraG N-terminal domain-containing protein [Xenorhabdus hominickii]AOM41321.1 conjugal transfer protein TraG [Xenorhabdus hominickii]PHM55416.1 conjugal transfer protein TraG [Xenorhabdus hominickii]PHM57219.1 conjugal transfer protein TraG [Xenorhabdus hominickii]